jgi:PPOX class probable F420-dependent enzyme
VALHHDTLYTPVDAKPKRSRRLRRVANIERDPRVTILVDEYLDDWSALWWVRLRGLARILDGGDEWARAADLLRAKYAQYRRLAAAELRPIIAIDVDDWSGWAAAQPGTPTG